MNILKRLKHLNPISHSLHLAGVGTTVASVMGSYQYVLVETQDQMMSAAFAAGLAICIYSGWEFAFNASRLSRRLIAAAIALSAAGISGYTVYQHNQYVAQQAADAAYQAQQTKADSANNAQRQTLLEQKTALQNTIDDLRRQTAADQKQMETLDGKNKEWQAAQIRKLITERNAKIDAYNQQQNALITQINKLSEPIKIQTKPLGFNLASLIRAGMFEIMTVLCLLFASWTRQEKQSSEAQQVATLESVTYRANAALASLELALNQANDAKQATLAELNQYSQTLVAQTQQQLEQGAHTVHEATAKLIDIKKAAISNLANYAERLQASVEHADQLQKTLSQTTSSAVAAYENLETAASNLNETAQKANELRLTLADLNQHSEQKCSALANIMHAANDTESKLDNSHASAIRTLNHLHMQIETAKNCKSSFAHANQIMQMEEGEQNQKISKPDLILALKNRLIPTNDRNRLPVDYLKSKTGLGKPTILQVLDECEKLGILTNTGNGYTYADEASVSSIQTMPANVVSLRSK